MDSINTNMASLYAQNNLSRSQSSVATSIQRLSSGLRINSAADDAAGYAISQNMTTQISGDNQASLNASNGVSLAQTAQGDMSTILTNLQTMYGLAVEASNATNTSADRVALNDQMQQLLQQNNLTAQSSNFNGVSLLNGTFNGETFQVGANNSTSNQISITGISSMLNTALGGSGTSYQTTVAATNDVSTTTALAAGDLTLNGYQVGATTVGAAAGQDANSAYSVAQAINAISAQSGVQAAAAATTVTGTTADTSAIAASLFTINGVAVGAIAAGGTVAGEAANIAAAVNLVSAQTGVTATANATTGAVTYTASDGRNIDLSASSSGNATTAGTDLGLTVGYTGAAAGTGVTTGKVTLTSTASSGITIGGANAANAGFPGTQQITTSPSTTLNVQSLSTTDLLTQTDAQNAMTAIQGAINTVTANAAQMGALQNRFAAVVTGIQTDSQNLSTSLSAIQDTNYAAETANLSKEQVMAQAGTAMLAQANQLPNQVLTLLR
jgi:flagellin